MSGKWLRRSWDTCKRRNTFPRLKLTCSTAFAYFDILTDILIFIQIVWLVGTRSSRQYWIYWSFLYFVAPNILHSYYLVYCEGWKNRSLKIRLWDAIVNMLFLRPLLELINSCKVSIELEEAHLDNDFDMQLAMNGKYLFLNTMDSIFEQNYSHLFPLQLSTPCQWLMI